MSTKVEVKCKARHEISRPFIAVQSLYGVQFVPKLHCQKYLTVVSPMDHTVLVFCDILLEITTNSINMSIF